MKPFLMIFISLAAWAQNGNDIDRRAAELKAIFAPLVMATDRSLLVYHYERKNFPLSNEEDVRNHLNAQADRFFDTSAPNNNIQGAGLYLAVDPAASRSFSNNDDPQLYSVTLPKGIRLLNLTVHKSAQVAKKIKKIARGCGLAAADQGSYNDVISKFAYSDQLDCRQVLAKAVSELNIDGFMAEYDGMKLDQCRSRGTDVVLISSSAIDKSVVAFNSNSQALGDQTSAAFTSRLYDEAMKDPELPRLTGIEGLNMPTTLGSASVSDRAYAQWKTDLIFGCGALRSAEVAGH